MKSVFTSVPVVLLLLTGCAVTHEAESPTPQPEVINITPLPPLNPEWSVGGMKLNLLIHVRQDGTVDQARMLGSSGDKVWDSLAVQAIKQWRYDVPRRNGTPTDVWMRQLVVIQIQEPVMMTVGKLIRTSRHEADSLYALVEKGNGADSLFKETVETCDILKLAPSIRSELLKLRVNDVTRPIRVGETYVIYKRFPRGSSADF